MKTMLVLVGFVLMIACFVISTSDMAQAWEILGTGTGSLLGGDLTDPEDDGNPEADEGYDVIFSSNDEPGFAGGEFAFNVFDNRLGPSNDKWCCGPGGGIPDEGLHITVELEEPQALTHFTVSSANDTPGRDPADWEVQGSNDGTNFTTIFSQEGPALWDERLQVILLKQGKISTFNKPRISLFGLFVLTPHRTRLGRTIKLAKLSTSAARVLPLTLKPNSQPHGEASKTTDRH